MSITYSFHLATERASAQVGDLLGVTPESSLPTAYSAGRSTYVLVKAIAPDPIGDALFRSAYGFAPRVAVTVELDKDVEDGEAQEGPALYVMRRLCEELTEDMYASYLGDYPVLVRRRGVLVFDAQWLQHRPWFRRAFGGAYEIAELVDPYSEPA